MQMRIIVIFKSEMQITSFHLNGFETFEKLQNPQKSSF